MLESQRGFSLRAFWHSFVERIWIVALCVLAGLFIGLGYLSRTPKSYSSHAVLEVDFAEPFRRLGCGDEVLTRSLHIGRHDQVVFHPQRAHCRLGEMAHQGKFLADGVALKSAIPRVDETGIAGLIAGLQIPG